MAASLSLPIRLRVPVPSNWIRGFIQLTGLVRDGRWEKTLDPSYSSRGLHGRPSSAACFCPLVAYAETSSERGLLEAVASRDQRGYASCIILHRDDVLFQLPSAVRGRNLRGPMAL
jgi:hypothetical protein